MRVEKDLRSISLTSILSKGVEWYAREWVMEIVEDLFDPHQFGSCNWSSTLIALAGLIYNWLTALEKPDMVVQVLMLDFRKAFDKVDYKILLSKLVNTGVPDIHISCITNFLYQRQQWIKISSKSVECTCWPTSQKTVFQNWYIKKSPTHCASCYSIATI